MTSRQHASRRPAAHHGLVRVRGAREHDLENIDVDIPRDALPDTLQVEYRGKNIADVLGMTADGAWTFFAGDEPGRRSLAARRQVGVGYLRLGQPATEWSGGEAQRIKLAAELQHGGRAGTLYVLDEPAPYLRRALDCPPAAVRRPRASGRSR